MRYVRATGASNGKDAPPTPAAVAAAPPVRRERPSRSTSPTDVEAAELTEEESRPDGTSGGVVTP